MNQEPCAECGMPCTAGEYHPYAACMMFKQCHNSGKVRENLAFVMERGREVDWPTDPMPLSMSMFATRAAYEAALAAQQPEPAAWAFQHKETGRMMVCVNDGINTPEVFAALNPRHSLIGPLYAAPAPPEYAVAFVGSDGKPAWIHDGGGLGEPTALPVGSPLYARPQAAATFHSFADRVRIG